jgi:histidinol-phosphatase
MVWGSLPVIGVSPEGSVIVYQASEAPVPVQPVGIHWTNPFLAIRICSFSKAANNLVPPKGFNKDLMMSTCQERLQCALGIAREAGDLTLRYFRATNYATEIKPDATPVTQADREAELLLRERIAAAFPEDEILGEEFPSRPGTSGYRWILDPLDGTKSFIRGVPLYGTLVAVEYLGQFEIGVIYIPATEECVYAARGQGAWYTNGKGPEQPARVSDCQDLSQALLLTTDIAHFRQIGRPEVWSQLASRVALTRTWGDCYGYLLVATGRAEIMIDPIVSLWDAAALLPILEEAGGHLTDWNGERRLDSGSIVATNDKLFQAVLEITGGNTSRSRGPLLR